MSDSITKVTALIKNSAQKRLEIQKVPGSFTAEVYAERTGVSVSHARRMLAALRTEGSLVRVLIPSTNIYGRYYRAAGYALKEDYEKFVKAQKTQKAQKAKGAKGTTAVVQKKTRR